MALLPRNNSSSSVTNFDRPNRLKGREDGIIRWGDLLEKFRSVQERARRSQRTLNGGPGDYLDDASSFGMSPEFRISESAVNLENKVSKDIGAGRGGANAPLVPAKGTSTPSLPQTKAKSSLGKQLGRFGGAVSGRVKRGH